MNHSKYDVETDAMRVSADRLATSTLGVPMAALDGGRMECYFSQLSKDDADRLVVAFHEMGYEAMVAYSVGQSQR